jgi:hypothetical protein
MSAATLNRRTATPEGIAATSEVRQSETNDLNERFNQKISVCKIAKGAMFIHRDITVMDALEEIRDGTHAAAVNTVRDAVAIYGKDTPEVKTAKCALPAFLFSGKIEGKVKQAMEEGRFLHSGLLQLDFDKLDDPAAIRDQIAQDPHVLAAWLSPSGDGVKGLFVIEPATTKAEHLAAFFTAEAYWHDRGLTLDSACKNSNRLCFASHDPDLKWNEDAVQLTTAPPPRTAPKAAAAKPSFKVESKHTTGDPLTPQDVREMLATIPPRPPYEEWLKIASAVWNALGESEGTAALCEWSTEEHAGEYAQKYAHRLERVTAGTLIHTAQANGWKRQAGILKGVSRRTNQSEQGEEDGPSFNPVESFFYDGTKYFLDAGFQYIPMDQRSVVRHLKNAGIASSHDVDQILCDIQVEKFISFAGALAGHPRGLHVSGGCRLLATTSPEIIQPATGQWPTIRAVLEGLLLDDIAGKVQLENFLGWLKFARESLTSNRRRPGQAIALAGQRGSGKSLLLDLTELALGGRRANPYAFFTGRTNFNADIAGAELLAVDDEAGSCDIRSRKTFAANIKSCLFSGSVRIEPKHRTAFNFRPVWRMLLALNDEPEALLVLPPITEDIADKITLFRCHKRPLPMPAHTLDERETFFAKLCSELPALLDWLEKWDVPAELREERCGVTFYHHPELLASLHQLSPEGHLACLVDTLAAAADDFQLPWTGTASELKASLCIHSTTARDADKLLQSPNSTGTYLGRLEGSRVERLPQCGGIQRWKFNPS